MGLYIDATRERTLRNYPVMWQKLCKVIQLLFYDTVDATLNGKKVSGIIRNHNECTVNVQFPSKHGIAGTLPVRELLLIKRTVQR